jgi:hypothetical protein
MTKRHDDQVCSDLAYQAVLEELGLPPGTKLHETKNGIERWQYHFNRTRKRKGSRGAHELIGIRECFYEKDYGKGRYI